MDKKKEVILRDDIANTNPQVIDLSDSLQALPCPIWVITQGPELPFSMLSLVCFHRGRIGASLEPWRGLWNQDLVHAEGNNLSGKFIFSKRWMFCISPPIATYLA